MGRCGCWFLCAWLAALLIATPALRAEGDGTPLEETIRPSNSPSPEPSLTGTRAESPLGFTGPSGILPRDYPMSEHFVPVEDRWRIGFPDWDRYGKGHPRLDDYPYVEGQWWDPFNQNVLKGDYPIIGQHTFLDITATSLSLFDFRQLPTATTPFESTVHPFQEGFFGKPNQFLYQQFFWLSADLFHGDSSFKPVDWRIKVTPVFNVNYLAVEELAVVSPDVRPGTTRGRTWGALEEWFVEKKLADLSPNYDFLSIRVGSQPFTSDFRGFLFSDTNRAVRLFGTLASNRDQFNVAFFSQQEKDTNSGLNTFDDRGQQVVIANYYHQDFIWPGYTIQGSVTYDRDQASFHFNKNSFLVRPDPVGIFQPHQVDAVYLGFAGDGHINRFNISHQYYLALGRDSNNPLANQAQDIIAHFAAVELSYDRDWARFRTSFLYSSGDGNINNKHATGFDSIMDNPNFAGGDFSFWQRQAIPLFGVNLVNRESLLPDLRSDKAEGQANFVNPGLFLFNIGVDFDLTPKLRMINNVNFLWFDKTNVLEQFLFQDRIDRFIGVDLSTGLEYRPLLSSNVIVRFGLSMLIPGQGFQDIYSNLDKTTLRPSEPNPLLAAFLEMNFTF